MSMGAKSDQAPSILPGYWRRHVCKRRSDATREAPAVIACDGQPTAREGEVGPFGVTERPVVPTKRLTTVEGRGLG